MTAQSGGTSGPPAGSPPADAGNQRRRWRAGTVELDVSPLQARRGQAAPLNATGPYM